MSTLVLICYVILNTSPVEQSCHVEEAVDQSWTEFCQEHTKAVTTSDLAKGYDRFGRARRVSVCQRYFGTVK